MRDMWSNWIKAIMHPASNSEAKSMMLAEGITAADEVKDDSEFLTQLVETSDKIPPFQRFA